MRNTVFHVEVKDSSIDGLGVFATKAFKKGDLIGIISGYIPETIDDYCPYAISFENPYNAKYYFTVEPTAPFCYLNHAEDSNAITISGPVIFALEDISKGEEITISYGDDWEVEEDAI